MRNVYLVLFVMVVAAMAALFQANCFAYPTTYYVGPSGGNLNDPCNWDIGQVPDENYEAILDKSGMSCEVNQLFVVARLIVGDYNSGAELNIRDGGYVQAVADENSILLGRHFGSAGGISVFTFGQVYSNRILIKEAGDGSFRTFGGTARIPNITNNGIMSLDHGYVITNHMPIGTGSLFINKGYIIICPTDYAVGDITGNGFVDFRDFSELANNWLYGYDIYSGDDGKGLGGQLSEQTQGELTLPQEEIQPEEPEPEMEEEEILPPPEPPADIQMSREEILEQIGYLQQLLEFAP
jgi:hypothetical protein